jgi:hypothetical protein
MRVVCQIEKYDENVTEAPFKFITLEEYIQVDKPENDPGGCKFASILNHLCYDYGYIFRFYSTCNIPGIDYTIVVRGGLERKLGI